MALKITLKHGKIGTKPQHRANLEALGLRKIGQSVVKKDNAATRGQILVVRHLVTVEEVAGE
ncbi:50S ribosomal protein L30 [Corynebacterium cystitidis]|uniref:Large ribosomal subunit protein uL30 n=1 Tax=Corynebacterium cystitidis DSM 20524 TaxID=1121357 RepID=A0A1H9R3Y0_9CORY|nr:50S ribosomal protein L30 [Corynebacterium cystitidis]WJY81559.1 50S ribosomal protein L30 [Corynebacterium cystitidis DSM 20524]SER67410.1 large subunit ribosomal protein L30 [Corynebacterium cystitidis DSM 20524]SNV86207.1 50S ribosomal protein L30 [Corynebacterium cystitidis]